MNYINQIRDLFVLDGGDTSASHPGRVQPQRFRVAASYPIWPIVLGVFWVLSLFAALDGFHWTGFALLGLATYGNYAWWGTIGPWFRTGDVCAGLVVSEDPLLVASFTDLAVSGGVYPSVKVQREPAKQFRGDSGKLGKRVVSVARYYGNGSSPCWSNFFPRAVQCATDDERVIQRLMSEISATRWNQLQESLKRLPQPLRPGLYRLTRDG